MNSLGNTKLQEYVRRLHRNDASLTYLDLNNKDIDDDGATSLAQALQVNEYLQAILLHDNNISDNGAADLANALQVNESLRMIGLYNNIIGDKGAAALAKALQVNKSLTMIDLKGNNIGDSGALTLGKALQFNKSLTLINLNDNNIGEDGVVELAKGLQANPSLQELYLNRNTIGDDGAAELAKTLQLNESLTVIGLAGNKIGDKGATTLAEALQANTTLQELYLEDNNINDEGAMRLLEALEKYNGTLASLSLSHDLQTSITELVKANNYGRRNPPPCPRPMSELFVRALKDIKTGDWEVSIVPQLETMLQFMSDFFQLSLFYTTLSANCKLEVIDVNERNQLLLQALEMARKWCTCGMSSACYKLALDKAEDDGIINDLKRHELEANATVTLVENADFIKKMKQDIQYNADRNSEMERGIKNMCNALSEEFKSLNHNVQQLRRDTTMMGEVVNAVRHNVEVVDNNQNQMRNALVRKLRVETGVAFVSTILNAVSFGAAGPALQGIANLTMGYIIDFSDLAHVRKVLNSEMTESVESIAISDVIEWGLETAEERANMQLTEAIKTQDTAFMITKAATILSLYCETGSEDAALPSQVGFSTGEPPSNVNIDRDIEIQPEKPPSNVNLTLAIERSVEASDAVFSKNAHCFYAHAIDPENVTKVFEASLDLNDFKKQELCVFAAITSGYIEDLEHDLSEGYVDLNGRDSRERTCTDFAAVMGRLDMVQLILEKGGTFGVFARSVMMPLARERDAARKKYEENKILE
jgi:Ran GTPase-activating protein (RanGAP) involved in mRNA processing and transport